MPTYTGDGMQSSTFATTVDESDPSKVSGIKGTAPAAAPEGIEHPFLAAFAETGVDTIFSSYYYDCTILMGLAIMAADSEDGAAIAEAFASNLEGALSIVGAPVPSQFMLMLPYVVTILAVAGLVGRSRGPAAAGEPYIKE